MDKLIRLILVTLACVATQACADHPTTAGPVKAAISTTSAATAETPPPANPVPVSANTQRVVLDDKTLTQAEVNQLLSQGYKPRKGHDDQILYCRSEPQLGSRFEKKVCLTGTQIKNAIQDSKDETRDLERNIGNPGTMCATKCS
jgi:hypothetical protein